jgi:hypothetical protein
MKFLERCVHVLATPARNVVLPAAPVRHRPLPIVSLVVAALSVQATRGKYGTCIRSKTVLSRSLCPPLVDPCDVMTEAGKLEAVGRGLFWCSSGA